jgi:hypothetical protein
VLEFLFPGGYSPAFICSSDFFIYVWFLKNVLYFRGYNIGTRLVDEFLAKSNVSRCVDFKETADVIAKVFAFLVLVLVLFCRNIISSQQCMLLSA